MFVSRWTLSILLGIALSGPISVAWAEGNITFRPGIPAVQETQSDSPGASPSTLTSQELAASVGPAPGFNRAIMPPITPEESEQAVQSRSIAPDLNQPDVEANVQSGTGPAMATMGLEAAPIGPASIVELARAMNYTRCKQRGINSKSKERSKLRGIRP